MWLEFFITKIWNVSRTNFIKSLLNHVVWFWATKLHFINDKFSLPPSLMWPKNKLTQLYFYLFRLLYLLPHCTKYVKLLIKASKTNFVFIILYYAPMELSSLSRNFLFGFIVVIILFLLSDYFCLFFCIKCCLWSSLAVQRKIPIIPFWPKLEARMTLV